MIYKTLKPQINTSTFRHIAFYILINIFKAIKTKHIPLDSKRSDFEILSEILNQEPSEIYQKILYYIQYYEDNCKTAKNNVSSEDIIAYIEEHFTDPDISLEQIADIFHMSPSSISRAVKNQLGINFYKFLTQLRVEYSKKLLTTTNIKIEDIYLQSGFNSKQTFSRTFKSAVGLTPSEYRKTIK